MDLNKFFQELIDANNAFKQKCNEALKPLPPIEQFEATNVVACTINQLNSATQWITNVVTEMSGKLEDFKQRAEDIIAARQADYLQKQIAAGEVLTKETAQTNADTAAQLAAKAREDAVRGQITLLATRRAELFTAKSATEPALLTREAVEKISDEVILADDYLASAAKIAGRLGELQKLGVDMPKLLARAMTTPLDEKGEAEFSEQLSDFREYAEKHGSITRPPSGFPSPFAGAGGAGGVKSDLAGVF